MFCTKCGKQIEDGNKFCTGCGSRIENQRDQITLSTPTEKICYTFPQVPSKVPLSLMPGEILIAQHTAAFVAGWATQGIFSLTNSRIIFTQESAGKAFIKRGLIGLTFNGMNVPNELRLGEITSIESVSCIQGRAAMLITLSSGDQYKIALQNEFPGKTDELCEERDRVVWMVRSMCQWIH